VGSSFRISLQIDQNQPIAVDTYAVSPTLARAVLESSQYFFQLFRRGRLLQIHTARGTMIFNLTNSARVLDITLACANSHMTPQTASMESNPFSGSTGTAVAANPKEDHVAETTTYLANILSSAGIQGFVISPLPVTNDQRWEVAWTAPTTFGLAMIDEKPNVDESAAVVISVTSGNCKGNFASTKQRTADGKVLLLKAACKASQGQSFQYSYTIAPRAAGGSYIMCLNEEVAEASATEAPQIGPRLLEASHSYFELVRPH